MIQAVEIWLQPNIIAPPPNAYRIIILCDESIVSIKKLCAVHIMSLHWIGTVVAVLLTSSFIALTEECMLPFGPFKAYVGPSTDTRVELITQ